MGEHEGWAEPPSGLLPNGLLPNEAASLIRVLDSNRWMKAEERTAELIACIQPNPPSEERRNAVADYVQRLIMKCFPCQVFTFGSVPLKTYLPDGDIDLTAFGNNPNLKETWAHQVRDMLESEEKNENAEFRVKEVQYIQAEVKIIKCLVENIVVDISFNQLGGLCTLCFLEEVDHLINQNHLFKRSIILIKAWCYYESRILGAHHGLISTYALETLVLYIFHVFNNSFAGPLEVLYRFLEFFSKFDWENFCISLWGPVPISSLPDVTAEPPRKDGGELLLNKLFLDACSSVYAVLPGGQENLGQGQPFVAKHFNVIDPLRVNNNLGRSVNKGNFFRIRSAFAFGAKKLARLLDSPEGDLVDEVDQFFLNTWDRHGKGHRPDAPRNDLWRLRLSNPDQQHESENVSSNSSGKMNDISTASRAQSQKSYGNLSNSRNSDQTRRDTDSNQKARGDDKGRRSSKVENLAANLQGRFLFARTRSSPELTETYGEVSSRGGNNRTSESGKAQISSARLENNRRKNQGNDDPPSVRHVLPHQGKDSVDSNSRQSTYQYEVGPGMVNGDFSSVGGTHGMHQEAQDLVNMMTSSTGHGFNGQVHFPVNLGSGHMPFPIPPSVLASMGFAQRNFGGLFPTNVPMIDIPWNGNMQFPQGLVPPPLAHYFPGIGLTSNTEDLVEPVNENFGSSETNQGECENDFWHEQDLSSNVGLDLDNVTLETLHSTRIGSVSPRVQQRSTNETQGSAREDRADNFEYEDNRGNDLHFDERTTSSRSIPGSRAGSLRSRTSSESSWEGTSGKVSKTARERRGRKVIPSGAPPGKGKSVSDHSSVADDDSRDGNFPSTTGEMVERNTIRVSGHHMAGFEQAQANGSDPMIPMGPVFLGSGPQPIAFYPAGPPVPFLTMLPFYNFPSESGTSDASTSHFSADEGLDNSDSGQNFDSPEVLDQSELSSNSVTTVELSEHKPDILNSDFASHWQNLQIGRLCQNSRAFPSPFAAPPAYLPGRFPLDGPVRPLANNANLLTQLMSHGPRLVPVAPLQSVPNRPSGVHHRYVEELPRYRSGTGTYLPNPKVSARERERERERDHHSASTRRGNYSYDRSDRDHHGDQEGNWNTGSKQRGSGRNHNRSQADKPTSRSDRLGAAESRADRPWSLNRPDSFPSYQSQNGPVRANSTQSGGSSNAPYNVYPVATMNPSGVSSNGLVMFYPYDHTAGYGSPAEQMEFGSAGHVGFSGSDEVASQLSEGDRRSGGVFDEQRFRSGSGQRSSPDQPSSPHLRR